jgi:DNA-binding transcriptional LysR family regulator
MELRQLDHFRAVAEEGHFTRAASRCRMSQSALSASIRALEKELDSRLFMRTTRKVELTEAGRVLLEEARRTLAAAASARESVLAVRGLLRGSLRVGGIPTPGLLDQAALLARFRDQHPAVGIRYVRDTSMALIPEIQAGRLDVALVSLPRQLPEPVRATPLSTQPMMFVARPDHPLAGRTQVTIASLADQDFVGPPHGSTGYEAVDRALAGTGKQRRVSFEAVDVLTILDFVAHGLGFTLLPQYLATNRPDLQAIPLAHPDMTWTLAAIMSRHQATPAGRAFAALLPQPGPPQQPRPSPRLPGPAWAPPWPKASRRPRNAQRPTLRDFRGSARSRTHRRRSTTSTNSAIGGSDESPFSPVTPAARGAPTVGPAASAVRAGQGGHQPRAVAVHGLPGAGPPSPGARAQAQAPPPGLPALAAGGADAAVAAGRHRVGVPHRWHRVQADLRPG